MKTHFYRLGVELLDENKRPLEHLEYDTTHNVDYALDLYDKWDIDDSMGKYLFLVTEDGEELEIKSEGYVKLSSSVHNDNKRLATLLYNAIVLIEHDFDSIENVINALGMTSEEYDDIMFSE